ncbi:MAG TPA: amidase [Anaerolineae bacterium]|nr:amidase [Anaerolineae bacterium]
MSDFHEYSQYDGLGLADLVRNGEVTPLELVEEAIARIERLNPQLNAVVHKMYDIGREAAAGDLPDGPFKGVPFLLKNLLTAYDGAPLSNGCRFFKDCVSDHDSEIVKRYKAAGVITLGRTNSPEFGLTPYTEPELFGAANNPWDLTRTTGGSSGGSGAVVAARIVPMAHGGDGGGSIRIPASCCGVFGMKPTRGRNPSSFDFEIWQGAVCEHVLTRSVRDSAAMLDATAGPTVGARFRLEPPERPYREEVGAPSGKLRIAYSSYPLLGHEVHADCEKGLAATVALCEGLGHEMIEDYPPIDGHAMAKAFLTMLCSEIWADIDEAEQLLGIKATSRHFEPATWGLGLLGKNMSGAELITALRSLERATRQIGRFFTQYDMFLTPALSALPVKTGELQIQGFEAVAIKILGSLNAGGLLAAFKMIDSAAESVFDFVPYTVPFNVTGQPAMSVPLFWNDDGLPVGMHFVGQYGDEATLFRLAGQLEQAQPWADRVPPICA